MANKVSRAGQYINLTGCPIGQIQLGGDDVVEWINAAGAELFTFDVGDCIALGYVDISGCALASTPGLTGCTALFFFDASNNAMDEAAVDAVLDMLDTNGVNSGEVNLSGGTNAIPSAAGLTSKANLEGKGWTVTVNS